jgi:hypothetical protein
MIGVYTTFIALFLMLFLSFDLVSEIKILLICLVSSIFYLGFNKYNNVLIKRPYYVLFFILVLGLIFRLYFLGHQSFWIDESFSVLSAQNIKENFIPSFESPYLRSVIHSYMLFIMGEMFSYTEFSMRILSVLFGMVGVYFSFLIGRKFNVNIALIFSFIMSFSTLQIAWARQARMYIFLQTLFLISIYYYLNYLEKGKPLDFFKTSFFSILSSTFHIVGLTSLVSAFLNSLILEPKKTVKLLYNKWMIAFLVVSSYFFYRIIKMISFSNNFFNYLNYFLFEHLLFLVLFIPGLILIHQFSFYKKNYFLEITLLINLISVMFLIDVVNLRYSFLVLPLIYLYSSITLDFLFSFIKNKYFALLLILCLLFISGFGLQKEYKLEPDTPMPPFKELYSYVNDNSLSGDFAVTHGALHTLYYGSKPSYYIPISLSGKTLNQDKDSYTGALVWNTNSFVGFIVIDDMAFARLSKSDLEFVRNQTLIKEFGNNYWHKVYLYEAQR